MDKRQASAWNIKNQFNVLLKYRGSHSNMVIVQRLHQQNPAKQEKMRRLFPGRLKTDHGEERAIRTQEIKEHRQELAGRQHRDVHPECTLHSTCGAGMSKMTKAGQLQSNVGATLKTILVLANRVRCHICVCMVGSARRVPHRNLLHTAWAYVGSCDNRFTRFKLLRDDL